MPRRAGWRLPEGAALCQDQRMRCAAGIGLLLLVGCNQIFGIASTQPWDAPPGSEQPPLPRVRLTWQIATPTASGAPADPIYLPLSGAKVPRIRIAPLDGEFIDANYAVDGSIEIPQPYFVADGTGVVRPWRLEYAIPSFPLHEIQWAPDEALAHITVPIAGRPVRDNVPVGSSYTITPSNFMGAYTNPWVFSTGLWTRSSQVSPKGNGVVDYDLANAEPMSGDKGSLSEALGDRAFLVDFGPDAGSPGCLVAIGSAALSPLALKKDAPTQITAEWDSGRLQVPTDAPSQAMLDRLFTGLGTLNSGLNNAASTLVFGPIPSVKFPGLTSSLLFTVLPAPVMIELGHCPTTSAFPKTAKPELFKDTPYTMHVQLVSSRSALGVTLHSGIEAVLTLQVTDDFKMEFPAAIPTRAKLTTPAGMSIDLVDGADQQKIGSPIGAFVLSFTPENTPGLRADYFDVIVHKISGSTLAAQRIYTVTSPSVRIDGSVFAPATDYVFEIRSYKGHTMAGRGDFAPVDYPYGGAVVFTRTIRTE
jgi:hypothetical protein